MKNLVLLLALCLSSFSINATNSNNLETSKTVNQVLENVQELTIINATDVKVNIEDDECTVSATVETPVGSVSISSTQSTCAAAVKDVAAGVKEILAQF